MKSIYTEHSRSIPHMGIMLLVIWLGSLIEGGCHVYQHDDSLTVSNLQESNIFMLCDTVSVNEFVLIEDTISLVNLGGSVTSFAILLLEDTSIINNEYLYSRGQIRNLNPLGYVDRGSRSIRKCLDSSMLNEIDRERIAGNDARMARIIDTSSTRRLALSANDGSDMAFFRVFRCHARLRYCGMYSRNVLPWLASTSDWTGFGSVTYPMFIVDSIFSISPVQ